MKRKRQPTADVMREQLRLAADRIIELETHNRVLRDWVNRPAKPSLWRRILRMPAAA